MMLKLLTERGYRFSTGLLEGASEHLRLERSLDSVAQCELQVPDLLDTVLRGRKCLFLADVCCELRAYGVLASTGYSLRRLFFLLTDH